MSVLRLVLRGRHARVALEVAAEERLVREVQVVGDLLYAHRRVFEQGFGLQNHIVVDPLRNRLSADALDERGEVFGRDAELAGVESDAALFAEVFAQQVGELLEILFGTVVRIVLLFGMLREVVVHDIPDLVNRCGDQSADDVEREMGLRPAGFAFDLGDHAAHGAALFGRQRQCGDVDVDAAHEVGRYGDDVGLEILLRIYLQDIFRGKDEHRILLQPEFMQVERYGGLPFGADSDYEGVDAAREPEDLHLGVAAGRNAFAHQALTLFAGQVYKFGQRK